jgi:tRNA(fMet)-specific endonuclease VapC
VIRLMLDTNLCIAALRRRPAALRWLSRRSPDELSISAVVVFELWQGVALSADPPAERARVTAFLAGQTTVPFDDAAAAEAGAVAAELRRSGRTIGPFDTLLAGHARALGRALVTANLVEFARVEGLEVSDWAAEP